VLRPLSIAVISTNIISDFRKHSIKKVANRAGWQLLFLGY
jgi:hypothetical protein